MLSVVCRLPLSLSPPRPLWSQIGLQPSSRCHAWLLGTVGSGNAVSPHLVVKTAGASRSMSKVSDVLGPWKMDSRQSGHQPVLLRLGIVAGKARASKVMPNTYLAKTKGCGHPEVWAGGCQGGSTAQSHLERTSHDPEMGHPLASPSLLPGYTCPLHPPPTDTQSGL